MQTFLTLFEYFFSEHTCTAARGFFHGFGDPVAISSVGVLTLQFAFAGRPGPQKAALDYPEASTEHHVSHKHSANLRIAEVRPGDMISWKACQLVHNV